MATRKEFLKTAGLVGLAGMVGPGAVMAQSAHHPAPTSGPGWADDDIAKMALADKQTIREIDKKAGHGSCLFRLQ